MEQTMLGGVVLGSAAYFTRSGSNVTYWYSPGEGSRDEIMATKSMHDLYRKYVDDKNFKKVVSRIHVASLTPSPFDNVQSNVDGDSSSQSEAANSSQSAVTSTNRNNTGENVISIGLPINQTISIAPTGTRLFSTSDAFSNRSSADIHVDFDTNTASSASGHNYTVEVKNERQSVPVPETYRTIIQGGTSYGYETLKIQVITKLTLTPSGKGDVMKGYLYTSKSDNYVDDLQQRLVWGVESSVMKQKSLKNYPIIGIKQ
jgi:hypothetical protein